MRVVELVGQGVEDETRAIYSALDPDAPDDYRQLAAFLARRWQIDRPRTVGIAGGQGAGKSTLGRLLEAACHEADLRACVLSLDDYYLERAVRKSRGVEIHPILETRGPPGTHDLALLSDALRALHEPKEVQIPLFDKGIDDRSGWRTVQGPFDLVVLEGWCVGARALDPAELRTPINALEAELDGDGTWRRYVNDQLASGYAKLWNQLDSLVFLKVPSIAAVRRWRLQQEESIREDQRLSPEEIDRFVQHFERMTGAMSQDLSVRAEVVVELDESHGISGLRINPSPGLESWGAGS